MKRNINEKLFNSIMRRESVRAAFLGIHNEFIENEISRIEKIVPNKAEKLREKKMMVFPTFEINTYQVYSKKDKSYNKYYVSKTGDKSYECDCMDYLYNSQNKEDYSCKHIWLIRIYKKEGVLNNECSKNYLDYLYEEVFSDDKCDKYKKLISDMDELEIDMKKECQRVAKLL